MRRSLAEAIVAVVVCVWTIAQLAAVLDPSRASSANALTPVVGAIATGVIAILAVSRRNGRNGDSK